MAYTKTQWVNNEEPSINAENLNKMEQGIEDAQSSAKWGGITGPLSDQTDLNNALTELNSNLTSLAGSLAMIETSPATANHAVGDLIVYNNRLYKVTSAIASGEVIVVGTNVSATSVADHLTDMPSVVFINTPWEIADSNVISSLNSSDNYLLVCGKMVYYSIRFTTASATTGSTSAIRIKGQYSQYLPYNYNIGNGIIGTAHETWTNATSSLLYINANRGVGLSGGLEAGKGYIAQGVYFIA